MYFENYKLKESEAKLVMKVFKSIIHPQTSSLIFFTSLLRLPQSGILTLLLTTPHCRKLVSFFWLLFSAFFTMDLSSLQGTLKFTLLLCINMPNYIFLILGGKRYLWSQAWRLELAQFHRSAQQKFPLLASQGAPKLLLPRYHLTPQIQIRLCLILPSMQSTPHSVR